MIFGVKEVRNDLGEFSSDTCSACHSGSQYRFSKISRFLVVFFVSLIPLGSRYEAVCVDCADTLAVDAAAGRKIARAHFGGRHFALGLKTALKLIAAAAIVAAAVALPLTLRFPLDSRPETLKSLIPQTQDGLFSIQDRDGNVLGVVEVASGVKTLTFYNDASVRVNEPGADGSFIMHEYRQEATNDAEQDGIFLVRLPGNPGVLEDRYDIPVRVYHYDSENDTLGYSRGVADLTSIAYTAGKAVYPFQYFTSGSDAPSDYYLVLYLTGDKNLLCTFVPDRAGSVEFGSLVVDELENGRLTRESQYIFEDSIVNKAKAAGLTQQSSAQDILDFLAETAPTPDMITGYEYYQNTKVITGMSLNIPSPDGTAQSVSQQFSVTVKNGYYIIQATGDVQ